MFALSKKEVEQYKAMGVPDDKITVIPNGIDLSEYEDLPPRGKFRAKYGISEDRKIILYLGRIHKIKGIDFLIEAYANLVKNKFNDALLVIAGPDDGCLRKLQALIKALRIEDNVLVLETDLESARTK